MRTRDTEKEGLVKKKAIQMLAEDGIEGFSINKLAKECGISVATLYIYYQDKDDLIKQIGTEISKTFACATLKDFSADMSFKEGLKKQWENRSGFALAFPAEVACYEVLRHSQYGEHILDETLKEFKETMGSFFQNAIKRKELVPLSLETFWTIAYGPLYMLLRFHNDGKSVGGKPFTLSKKTMNECFELVIKALTP